MEVTIASRKITYFETYKSGPLFLHKILFAFFEKNEQKISTRLLFRGILIDIGALGSLLKLVKNGGRYGNF